MNRATTLRLSLLIAIGAIPGACGGTTLRGSDEDNAGNNAGGSSSKGGTSSAGTKARAGSSSKGGAPVTGGTGPGPVHCTAPQINPLSGLVTCAEHYSHRPTAYSCEVVGGAPAEAEGGYGFGGNTNDVANPADLPRADGSITCFGEAVACRAFRYGYCGAPDADDGAALGEGGSWNTCLSGCIQDADCGPGYFCVCAGLTDHGGECMPATCKTDADCGVGLLCASYQGSCGGGGYACQSLNDQCRSDADCGASGKLCIYAPGLKARICEDGAVCGRPFLVEAAARVASPVTRQDWFDDNGNRPCVDHLTAVERQALAEHWTQMGQMEHASIAAFARFSLQLLSLGAPPELVEACTAALADETAHTKLCFGIASAYAGRAIGPGPLDISGSLAVTSLADIVDLVIAEGCFGETGAALEALEAADAAADPVIAGAYSQIAADEQRHAELAFRFVRWALGRERTAVVERIQAALHSNLSQSHAARGVVEPCLSALVTLAQTAPPSSDRHEMCCTEQS